MRLFANIKNTIKQINYKNVFKNHRNLIITIGIISLIGLSSILISYAFFTSITAKNIISGVVGDVSNPDLNIKVLVENRDNTGKGNDTYTASYVAPTKDYTYNATKYSCSVGTLINNSDGTYTITSDGKTKCDIYYDAVDLSYTNDIDVITMKEVVGTNCKGNCGYKKVTDLSILGLINSGFSYNAALSSCTTGGTIDFDYSTNKIEVDTTQKATCTAYFYKAPIISNIDVTSTQNSITVKPTLANNDYTISSYYYSIDGTNYVSSSNSSYTFTGLDPATDYKVHVYAISTDNRKSMIKLKDISTSYTYAGTFNYTGAVQTYTAGADGYYRLQVWGAQGGSYSTSASYAGGLGGYSIGTVYLQKGTSLYIYVGGAGTYYTTSTYTSSGGGGFNGGGNAAYRGGGGGGGTDIRIAQDSLYARVIVAGGGGGSYYYSTTYNAKGGVGGGVNGLAGNYYSSSYSTWAGGGGTATTGGTAGIGSSTNYYGTAGSFGLGGKTGYKYNSTSYYSAGAGGGGWYGGGGAGNYSSSSRTRGAGGGGGSGYVYTESTGASCPSGCLLNSNYYLTSANTYVGNASFESTSGSSETGHTGNGYAKITYVGKSL